MAAEATPATGTVTTQLNPRVITGAEEAEGRGCVAVEDAEEDAGEDAGDDAWKDARNVPGELGAMRAVFQIHSPALQQS